MFRDLIDWTSINFSLKEVLEEFRKTFDYQSKEINSLQIQNQQLIDRLLYQNEKIESLERRIERMESIKMKSNAHFIEIESHKNERLSHHKNNK